MSKLSYDSYIVSSTGSGIQSPAGIDYHLPRIIAESDPACKGAHLIDPLVPKPTPRTNLGGWAKYSLAKFFHASIFGYSPHDWKASTRRIQTPPATVPGTPAVKATPGDLESGGISATTPKGRQSPVQTASGLFRKPFFTPTTSVTSLDLAQPTASHLTLPTTLTLAYSLCDSPTGLLSLILLGLQKLDPEHTLNEKELVTIVQLAWLPGPEGGLRYWSGADFEIKRADRLNTKPARASAAITSYSEAQGYGAPKGEGTWHSPVWAENKHDVVHVSRRDGARGLPWEQGSHLLEGVRALTKFVYPKTPAPSRPLSRGADSFRNLVDGQEFRTVEDDLELSEVVVHSSSAANPLHPHSSQPSSPVISQTYLMSHSMTRDSSASNSATRNARGEEVINEDTEPETPDLHEDAKEIKAVQDSREVKDLQHLEVPKRPDMEELGSSETVVGRSEEGEEVEKIRTKSADKGKGVAK